MLLLLATLLGLSPALATPPKSSPQASVKLQQVVGQLPGGKLTLDFILSQAMGKASSFRALEAGALEAEATKFGADGPYDWTLFGGYDLLDSRSDAASPFNPTGTESRGWNAGVRRQFSTGTFFETRIGNTYNDVKFANPAFRVPDYYESDFRVSISQDLWANSFGASLRADHNAALKRSEAQRLEYEESLETWSLDIIEQFYSAWIAQTRLQTASENLERRRELLGVTRLKNRRGTAERPDVLQVEAAMLLSESAVLEASTQLDHIWRSLVVMLKLPDEWLAIPPALIPLELHPLPPRAEELCRSGTEPAATRGVIRARLQLEAASLREEAALSRLNPKLALNGAFEANGINESNGTSRRETLRTQHPAWKFGVLLTLPLGFSLERSQLSLARAELMRASGALDASHDSAVVNLKQNCQYLSQAKETLAASAKALASQRERMRLENQRFGVGRSTTFQVIQAGDDHANTDQVKSQNEVNVRRRAWQVIQAASQLAPFLENWKKP